MDHNPLKQRELGKALLALAEHKEGVAGRADPTAYATTRWTLGDRGEGDKPYTTVTLTASCAITLRVESWDPDAGEWNTDLFVSELVNADLYPFVEDLAEIVWAASMPDDEWDAWQEQLDAFAAESPGDLDAEFSLVSFPDQGA